ncbi:hypothetical protein Zmor_015165 [Zophobas morio]|uniref:Uncharacterized protein n=1 Tax=Zophobas morio TaxID=2755281 RepID=A0AA38MGX2_9CUCU|nr:hypothetical protein Zmor_015165 [Zophobas morio]
MFVNAVFLFVTLLVISPLEQILCDCDQRYVTFCDCVSDLGNYGSDSWTDVIIDSTQQSCSSSVINNNSFEILEDIKLLFLVNSSNVIDRDAFKKIGKTLRLLKLYGNDLNHVRRGTFSGFRQLGGLNLTHNNIQFIEAFSFEDSVIISLDLSNNVLETIPQNAFYGGHIRQIIIKNNKLSFINDKAFDGHVEVLQLDYNSLEYIENGFLKNLPKLKELTMSHNRLSHISDIKSLGEVRKLDFSFNDINFIDTGEVEDLKELTYFDLSNNKLETFSLEAFKKVKNRMTLLLSYNLLTNVKIQDNSKPMTVTTFGNPWNCKCLTKMEQKMIQYNFTTTRCNLELLRSGSFPICVEDGDCQHKPTESRKDLRAFVEAINEKKNQLRCDVFRTIRSKDVVSFTPS